MTPAMSNTTPDSPIRQRLGDVRDLEQILKKSARAIYRDADSGRMPWGFKLGASRRWDLDEIEEWIRAGCKAVHANPTEKGM